ncbi:MAG: TetR/AcrR family transcriptional regulator [Alphaproteobacteria bacterium]|nr:TetR/AcrR family transcriptional regulator [Alphaproteobacteria bacterium SS10]
MTVEPVSKTPPPPAAGEALTKIDPNADQGAADDHGGDIDWQSPKAQQIMHAAADLFFENGFGGSSMGQIALKAGVSKGTLYNYFADKEALFGSVVRAVCKLHNGQLYGLKTGDADVRAVLTRVSAQFLMFVTGDMPTSGYRMAVAEAVRFPHLGQIFYDAGPREGIKRMADYLEWARDEGLIQLEDPDMAARELLEMTKMPVFMQRVLHMRGPVEEKEAQELAEAAVGKFLTLYPLTEG